MKKFLSAFIVLILVTVTLASCGGITVTWLDGDGTVLYTEKLSTNDTAIPTKPLPNDNDNWDYIEWQEISADEKSITYQAERVEIEKHIWKDADGTVLNTAVIPKGSDVPEFALPADTSHWDYTAWDETVDGNVTTYTAQRTEVETIIWTDVDGTVLYTVYLKPSEEIPERYLPNDTADWHYTGWKKTIAPDGGVKFVAERVANEKVHWLDIDGTLLYTDGVAPDSELTMRALPKSSAKWIYTAWEEVTHDGGERTFKALGEINPDYFKGNVFQIITYDLYGEPVSAGTGFVFNKSGWFITNSHVMDGAVRAAAIFEIENYISGDSYTVLEIEHGYYNHTDKDIFIGRIADYNKIANKYQSIAMVRDYEVGDITYSVGYPNASVKMEIHEGEVVSEHSEDFNSLYSKLYSGVTYIPSTSYITPESSGGILVNENLEVIGMTTKGLETKKGEFIIGAAIRVFNYLNITNTVNTSGEKSLVEVLYPEYGAGLKLFLAAEDHEKCTGLYENETGLYYQLVWENTYDKYEEAYILQVYDSGIVAGNLSRMWYSSSDILTSTLMGVYTGASSLDDFTYMYTYNWGSGSNMVLVSSNINYSSTVSQTLKTYNTSGTNNTVTNSQVEYAKKRFNETYVWLRDLLKEIG